MTGQFLVSILLLLAAGSTLPPEDSGKWQLIRDDGRVAVYLERPTTAQTYAARPRVTVKRVFAGPDERAYALDTLEIDCRAGTYRYLDVVLYDRDGDVVNRYHLADQPAPVPPASYLVPVRQLVCGKPPPANRPLPPP